MTEVDKKSDVTSSFSATPDAPTDHGLAFTQIRSVRLYEDVISQIYQLINSGQLPPGGRLPPERELAEQLGVSRNILREAFRVLEQQGIIVTVPGGGRTVRPDNIQPSIDTRGLVLRLEQSVIRDILESREIIEVQVVRFASARLSIDGAGRLRSVAKQRDTWEDNVTFHVTLASLSGNFMLQRLVQMHMDLLPSVHLRDHYRAPRGAVDLLEEHADIAEAVIARDGATAERLMHQHLSHTRDAIGLTTNPLDGIEGASK